MPIGVQFQNTHALQNSGQNKLATLMVSNFHPHIKHFHLITISIAILSRLKSHGQCLELLHNAMCTEVQAMKLTVIIGNFHRR